ncbi:hypothetical protein CLOM_g23868 [Closterium sp. NIES-68]|nr:hypothetical protein CLOM_g14699 [Closterium sp. NIES-68]GJP39504.1 hypothetical protein CLOM_g23868 [Closterium sp. NIES-68]GJP74699.1 hypothetical protein CLOP_g5246 [Closterium sp. NIES-67]GJP81793.1 hypothetical protein CLOP_g11919 [Closterium sp. NIES-67]
MSKLERFRPPALQLPDDLDSSAASLSRPKNPHPLLPTQPDHSLAKVRSPATSAACNLKRIVLQRCHVCNLLSIPPCRTCHLFLPSSFPAKTAASSHPPPSQPLRLTSSCGDDSSHPDDLSSGDGTDLATWLDLRNLPCRMMELALSSYPSNPHNSLVADRHRRFEPRGGPSGKCGKDSLLQGATGEGRLGECQAAHGGSRAQGGSGDITPQSGWTAARAAAAGSTWELHSLWEWAGQMLTWPESAHAQQVQYTRSLRHTVTAPARLTNAASNPSHEQSRPQEAASGEAGGREPAAATHMPPSPRRCADESKAVGCGEEVKARAEGAGCRENGNGDATSPILVWLEEARSLFLGEGDPWRKIPRNGWGNVHAHNAGHAAVACGAMRCRTSVPVNGRTAHVQ